MESQQNVRGAFGLINVLQVRSKILRYFYIIFKESANEDALSVHNNPKLRILFTSYVSGVTRIMLVDAMDLRILRTHCVQVYQ